MKIKWLGNAKRLAYTTGSGDKVQRHTLHVQPGDEVEIPNGVTLAHEGVNWEKATGKKEQD